MSRGEAQASKDTWASIFFMLAHNDAQHRAANEDAIADDFLRRAKAMSGLSDEEFEQELANAREAVSAWKAHQDESLGEADE
jgi:hypothetical protein